MRKFTYRFLSFSALAALSAVLAVPARAQFTPCSSLDPSQCAQQSGGSGSGGSSSGMTSGASPTAQGVAPLPMSPPVLQPGSPYLLNNNQSGLLTPNAQQQVETHVPAGPQEPTEFQRFVDSAIGEVLPIFGSSLFENVPSTFAPQLNAPVTGNYVIGPGDEILVQGWGQVNFNIRATVDRAGQIDIPQVGAITVAGLHYSQLDSFLRSQIGAKFRNFDLNVQMGQLRSLQIFLLGRVRQPGSFTLSSQSTLIDALFESGGPSADGSMRHIQLRRDGKTVADVDLYDLLIHGERTHDLQLQPGDIIFVPSAGPRVAIYGSVDNPAIYEITGNSTVGSLITLAGGASSVASTRRATLERIENHTRHIVEIQLDPPGLAVPLRNGDILRVFSIVPRFDNEVILRGNVANPGRYEWKAGMRIRDLIPDKDSLVTRDYWKDRAALGLPILDYVPLPVINPTASSKPQPQQIVQSGNLVNRQLAQRAEEQEPNSSETTSLSSSQQQQNVQNQQQSNLNQQDTNAPVTTQQLAPTNTVSGAAPTPSSPNNSTSATPAQQQSVASTSSPEVGNAPLTGQVQPIPQEFPAKNTVSAPVPDVDWAYAVIERMDPDTLVTKLIPFNLGAAVLNGDDSQNLPLMAGDVVTIFSKADMKVPQAQQTKFVLVEGEVNAAGTYSVAPGETLRQLVAHAGGLGPNAYLYGATFTRESAREEQQQRLDEYVQQISRDLERAQAQAAESNIASSSVQTTTTNEDQMLAQLRRLRASGRIVLDIRPWDNSLNSIPDIPLEDGDHLVIPPMPASVLVVGSVYNGTSFLYRRGSRAGDFLRHAGGPTRLADARHTFIIRADGSVVSRDFANGTLSGSFSGTPMYPGDSIVVPEKLIKPSIIQSLAIYGTLFSSLAITAAALAVVK